MSIQVYTPGGAQGPHIVIGDPLSGIQMTTPGGGVAAGDNWWELDGRTTIAAYQPRGAASLAASLADLTGNGNDASDSSLSWNAADGWTDGTAVTPGFITSTGVWTVAIHYLNPDAGNPPTDYLPITGTSGLRIWQRSTGNRHYAYHSPNFPSQYIESAYTGGVHIIAYDKYYVNGTLDRTLNTVAALTNGATVTINARGTAPAATVQAVAFWNEQLDASEVAELTTRMAAL